MSSVIVVSGVSGSGKSTVGRMLADALGRPFLDADDFHSDAAIARMRSGVPLTDADRWPWLDAVGRAAVDAAPCVVACSALSRQHRARLRGHCADLVVVQLVAAPERIAERLARRAGHFMDPGLLGSQLAAFESLGADEAGFAVEATAPADDLVARIRTLLAE